MTDKIRLWRLGSLEHNLIPTKGSIDKLRRILSENIKDGVVNIVWGPELDVVELGCEVETIDMDKIEDKIKELQELLETLLILKESKDKQCEQ